MHVRRKRSMLVVLMLVLVGALGLSASSRGGTDNTRPRQCAGRQRGGRVRRGVQGEPEDAGEDALQREAPAGGRDGPQHLTRGIPSRRHEGQLRPRAQVLEEQRLQHRHRRQADGRLCRGLRRERLPADLEDGIHPPGAHLSEDRQDHLHERPFGSEPGARRLPCRDRAARLRRSSRIRTSATP